MAKYYSSIRGTSVLSHRTGVEVQAAPEFFIFSAKILAQCVFLQSQIQQIIYICHGPEIVGAKETLKSFPNPKARVDFLCSFPLSDDDQVVTRIFDFARGLFSEIYELRNVLSHEVWSSSEEFPGAVLFSSLDENSRLLMASGKLWHKEDATPEDTYASIIRFISSMKVVYLENLYAAANDMDLCSWSLMNLVNILNEGDPEVKDKARRAFMIFQGTSHLFSDLPSLPETIELSTSRSKRIGGVSPSD